MGHIARMAVAGLSGECHCRDKGSFLLSSTLPGEPKWYQPYLFPFTLNPSKGYFTFHNWLS